MHAAFIVVVVAVTASLYISFAGPYEPSCDCDRYPFDKNIVYLDR